MVVGSLGVGLDATRDGGFDITRDGRGFAALSDLGTAQTGLYRIALAAGGGAATLVGPIGDGNTEVRSLAILPLDADADGRADVADNCPAAANAGQDDLDGDGLGDACDADQDGDGLSDSAEAAIATNPRAANSDGDALPDGADVCPALAAATPSGCPPLAAPPPPPPPPPPPAQPAAPNTRITAKPEERHEPQGHVPLHRRPGQRALRMPAGRRGLEDLHVAAPAEGPQARQAPLRRPCARTVQREARPHPGDGDLDGPQEALISGRPCEGPAARGPAAARSARGPRRARCAARGRRPRPAASSPAASRARRPRR